MLSRLSSAMLLLLLFRLSVMPLLQGEDGGIDFEFDVFAVLKGERSLDVSVAEMAFAGEASSVLSLDEDEHVEIGQSAQLHRSLHQNLRERDLQVLKLIYQTQQVRGGCHRGESRA